jgi:predicted unusual protein kinase regulating ubiquinone biosynthesis (AarF/ABC1/UbiB family)
MIMGLSAKPQHLRRYRDVARLLIRHGGAAGRHIVDNCGLEESSELSGGNGHVAGAAELGESDQAQALAGELEALGPTFVKLGQMLSTRSDLLPPTYLDALSRLQDRVAPFDFEVARDIIEQELGAKASRIFADIEPRPIAAASLGQVHRAALRDGRAVAVKVQRPGIREGILEDLDALGEIARFVDAHTDIGRRYAFQGIMAELRKSLLAELDYRQEARHLQTLGENLAGLSSIVVPQPIDDLCSERVLTMDLVRGHKITELSPVVLLEIDRAALAESLSQAYLKQILIDGFFHADPHPGNLLLTEDHRLALLDLGMVARLTPTLQESLVRLLMAISEGRGEDAADVLVRVAEKGDDCNETEFRRRVAEFVARNQHRTVKDLSAGRAIHSLMSMAADTGIRLPQEFTMVGKALMNLDAVSRVLDPDFDPNASIRRNATDLLRRRVQEKFSKGNRLAALLEASDFTQRLPARLNRIMENLADNRFSVQVDAIDEAELIRGLQKIANRITVGLILAAMIVGAALLMRVETRFTIMGYPGVAILLFAAAVLGGALLVINILRSDR